MYLWKKELQNIRIILDVSNCWMNLLNLRGNYYKNSSKMKTVRNWVVSNLKLAFVEKNKQITYFGPEFEQLKVLLEKTREGKEKFKWHPMI